jgi:hypothetical protein
VTHVLASGRDAASRVDASSVPTQSIESDGAEISIDHGFHLTIGKMRLTNAKKISAKVKKFCGIRGVNSFCAPLMVDHAAIRS